MPHKIITSKIITSAISSVLALGLTSAAAATIAATQTTNTSSGQEMLNAAPMQGMEKCFGIVKKGLNDCGSASHNCSGEAKQDADKNDWMYVPAGLCQKIVGGSTKPPAKV